MNIFGHDWTFWVALIGATIIRVATSPFHSIFRSVVMVITSVFVAWLFTDAVIDYLHLDPMIYKAPVGGLLALSADGFVRLFFTYLQNPGELIDLWKRFRGSGGAK